MAGPNDTYHQGAVTTADRIADIHPQSWDPSIHKIVPYRQFPLVAILNGMGGEPVDSIVHNWPNQNFDGCNGTITDVYTTAALSSAYASGGVVDQALYFKVTSKDAKRIIGNDTILVSNPDNNTRLTVDVVSTHIADDNNSYFVGKLMEADTGNDLAKSTLYWALSGHAEAEMSELPTAVSRDPEYWNNYTQIFMESCEWSGTELQEKERVNESKRTRDKADAMLRFRIKQERAFLFGVKRSVAAAGPNNKVKRYMQGIYQAIKEKESANILDYRTDSDYSGQSWLNGGLNWLEGIAEEAAVYSESGSKTVMLGSKAWLHINRAVLDRGIYKLEDRHNKYGIRIKTLIGLTQDWNLMLNPLFSVTPGFEYSAFVFEPKLLKKRPMRGRSLKYITASDKNTNGYTWVDGIKEGWVEECTLQYHNLQAMRWLDGIGKDNAA